MDELFYDSDDSDAQRYDRYMIDQGDDINYDSDYFIEKDNYTYLLNYIRHNPKKLNKHFSGCKTELIKLCNNSNINLSDFKKIISYYIRYDYHLNITDHNGKTAFMHLCDNIYAENDIKLYFFYILYNAKYDLQLKDNFGKSTFEYFFEIDENNFYISMYYLLPLLDNPFASHVASKDLRLRRYIEKNINNKYVQNGSLLYKGCTLHNINEKAIKFLLDGLTDQDILISCFSLVINNISLTIGIYTLFINKLTFFNINYYYHDMLKITNKYIILNNLDYFIGFIENGKSYFDMWGNNYLMNLLLLDYINDKIDYILSKITNFDLTIKNKLGYSILNKLKTIENFDVLYHFLNNYNYEKNDFIKELKPKVYEMYKKDIDLFYEQIILK